MIVTMIKNSNGNLWIEGQYLPLPIKIVREGGRAMTCGPQALKRAGVVVEWKPFGQRFRGVAELTADQVDYLTEVARKVGWEDRWTREQLIGDRGCLAAMPELNRPGRSWWSGYQDWVLGDWSPFTQ